MVKGMRALSGLAAIERLYPKFDRGDGLNPFLDRCLENSGYVEGDSLKPDQSIPAKGPLLVVANHPTGLLDGIIALRFLSLVREDTAVLANGYLDEFPILVPRLIPVKAHRRGVSLLRVARVLSCGQTVLAFPAGTIAHFQRRYWRHTDAPWESSLFRLACRLNVPVVPLHIPLQIPRRYAFFCAVSRVARTVLLPRICLKMKIGNTRPRVGPLLDPVLGPSKLLACARNFAVDKKGFV